MDRDFLRDRAYPYLRDAAVFIEAVTEKGEDGLRTLPLSSSPEINDNRLEAWFSSITNYDLALIRWLFSTTAEMARELGEEKDAQHWEERLAEMPEFALSEEDGRLLVAKEQPLGESHRHLSHLMAISSPGPDPLGEWRGRSEDHTGRSRGNGPSGNLEMDRVQLLLEGGDGGKSDGRRPCRRGS